VSWRGLRKKGFEILFPEEWNTVVDSLDELYGTLTTGERDINVRLVYGAGGFFKTRIYAEGRPVILDWDPIQVYQFYDIARDQITEAVDRARVTGISDLIREYTGASRDLLVLIYGKLPSADDVTSAVNRAAVTGIADLIREYTGASRGLLELIYGKVPSPADITVAVDRAEVTRATDLIRLYTERSTRALEAELPKLELLKEYARETRDTVVKLRVDEYGNLGVVIAEPLDVYGRVVVSAPSELVEEFKPVSSYGSISATANTAGFSVTLAKGGRPNVNVYYRLGGAGDVSIEVSWDGVTWRVLKTVSLAAAGSGLEVITGVAYPYIRVRTPTTGIDVEFEVVASR